MVTCPARQDYDECSLLHALHYVVELSIEEFSELSKTRVLVLPDWTNDTLARKLPDRGFAHVSLWLSVEIPDCIMVRNDELFDRSSFVV